MSVGVVHSGNPIKRFAAMTCSDLPSLQEGSVAKLSTRVKELRASTKSFDSISVFSDMVCDNVELSTALEGIGDPDTKLVLNIFTKMMKDLEKRLLHKMCSQIDYLESAFTQLQDILIEWNDQSLQMQCWGDKPDGTYGTEKDANNMEGERLSDGISCPHFLKPPIKLPSNPDIHLEVNKLIYGDTGTKQNVQKLQEAPTTSSPGSPDLGRTTTIEWKSQLSKTKYMSGETSRDKMQQRQKILSHQLHGHAKMTRAASQLPMWLQPQSGQPLSDKVVGS